MTRTEIDVLFGRFGFKWHFIFKRKGFAHVVVTVEEIKQTKVSLPHQHITAVTVFLKPAPSLDDACGSCCERYFRRATAETILTFNTEKAGDCGSCSPNHWVT